MTCYNPSFIHLKSVVDGESLLTHTKGMKLSKDKKTWYKFYSNQAYKNLGLNIYREDNNFTDRFVPVPCGLCIGCRLDYAREWANRCYCEGLYHKYGYFITLTYNNDNLPFGEDRDGQKVATLRKDDFRKFVKDLRNYFQNKLNYTGVRFFGCGEYGDKSFRPHYHILIWCDVPIPDLTSDICFTNDEGKIQVINKQSPIGDIYYTSDIVCHIWRKGNVLIGMADWRSCCYVSRYIIKKQKGESKKIYNDFGVESPFLLMSNRPGIGYQYFQEHKDTIVSDDYIICANQDKSFISKVPRYFNNLVKQDDIVDYFDKLSRDLKKYKDMEDKAFTNSVLKGSNDFDYLKRLEDNKIQSIKSLKRSL